MLTINSLFFFNIYFNFIKKIYYCEEINKKFYLLPFFIANYIEDIL